MNEINNTAVIRDKSPWHRYSFIIRLRHRSSISSSEIDWQGTLERVPLNSSDEASRLRFSRIECIPALIVEMLASKGKEELTDEP